jgi:hypothetical protein
MTTIIEQAFALAEAVDRFWEQARRYYYQVMLSGHTCPQCSSSLEMIQESHCKCRLCGQELDPTVVFQRCSSCGGQPRLSVRRYSCTCCGADIPSHFLFDGLVFDAEYFRQKMAESRERKQELRERVRQMLTESRSGAIQLPAAELEAVPGLIDALNTLAGGVEMPVVLEQTPRFSLTRYQAHINAHIRPFPMGMEQIPPLSENRRLDRIWRFIAIIFMAHAGILNVWQEGPTIMVIQRETNPERQGVPGDLKEAA